MLQIRPVAGKVLLHVPAAAAEVRDGIYIPERSRNSTRKAVVQRLPRDYRGDLCEGDEVVLPPFAGVEVKINGETMVFIKPAELYAAFE